MNDYDLQLLDAIHNNKPIEWGAWVTACLEYLFESGYITSYIGVPPSLTPKGIAALEASTVL